MLYYDVVFRNVEIFDGTGSESYVADVALKGDKIKKIGKSMTHTDPDDFVSTGRTK